MVPGFSQFKGEERSGIFNMCIFTEASTNNDTAYSFAGELILARDGGDGTSSFLRNCVYFSENVLEFVPAASGINKATLNPRDNSLSWALSG